MIVDGDLDWLRVYYVVILVFYVRMRKSRGERFTYVLGLETRKCEELTPFF